MLGKCYNNELHTSAHCYFETVSIAQAGLKICDPPALASRVRFQVCATMPSLRKYKEGVTVRNEFLHFSVQRTSHPSIRKELNSTVQNVALSTHASYQLLLSRPLSHIF